MKVLQRYEFLDSWSKRLLTCGFDELRLVSTLRFELFIPAP